MRVLPSLLLVGGIALLFYSILIVPSPVLLLLAAGMIGSHGFLYPDFLAPMPKVSEWDKAIGRYMAEEIDDFDLDLEGDYILRGLERPKIVPERKKLGPTPGHWSWCTCDRCVHSQVMEIEKAIIDQSRVPSMILGEPAKYARRLGENHFDKPYPIEVIAPVSDEPYKIPGIL